MSEPIAITPNDIVTMIIWFCGAIITVSSAVTIIISIVKKAKQPEQNQNERLDKLEQKVNQFEQFFDKDNKRLVELEEGNRVTQQSLLALLSHSINGNDIDKLTKARDDLQQYLIDKGGIHNA